MPVLDRAAEGKETRQRSFYKERVESAAVKRVARIASFLVSLAAIACSNSTSPTTASTTLHAEVADPIGDAVVDARVPRPPDLVHATADAAIGSITFVVQFAPGTLDRQTTRVSVLLDTDQDGSTGIRQGNGLGADYGVDVAAASGLAAVTKANPAACAARLSCFDPVGSVPLTFLTDAVQLTVPLSLLGDDDGRMNFQMSSYVMVAPLTSVTFDFMPDSNLPSIRIQ